MALQSDRSIPSDETFKMLRERADKDGDSFSIKVLRRAHLTAPTELVASMSGAMIEHFANPEFWIPPLCGGGQFFLQGFSPTDLSKPVGGAIQFKVNQETKAVDASVMAKADWRGPATLDYPQKETRDLPQGSMYDVSPPPGPGSGNGATAYNPAWPRSPGGGSNVSRQDYAADGGWQVSARALENERRKLEEERLANEREKHRQELEGLKKAHEADMRSFKAEIMGELRSKPTGPDPSITMMEALMRIQAENAKQAAEDRRERDKQAAEDRRASEERQARADERTNRMLEKLFERPKEDPLAIIEKVTGLLGKNNNADAQMKMMASMAEMHSMQIGTAMDFIQASADLQLGAREKEESPVIKGIEAVVKGIGSMAKGAQVKQAAAPQQFAQPQLPMTYEQQARAQQPAQQPAPQAPAPVQQKPVPTILEQLENGIRGKAPIADVAQAIVNHIKDPSVMGALIEVGMDFRVLVNNRLGVWANEHVDNATYLQTLMVEVEKLMRTAGYLPPEEAPAGAPAGMVEEDAEVAEEGDDEVE